MHCPTKNNQNNVLLLVRVGYCSWNRLCFAGECIDWQGTIPPKCIQVFFTAATTFKVSCIWLGFSQVNTNMLVSEEGPPSACWTAGG